MQRPIFPMGNNIPINPQMGMNMMGGQMNPNMMGHNLGRPGMYQQMNQMMGMGSKYII